MFLSVLTLEVTSLDPPEASFVPSRLAPRKPRRADRSFADPLEGEDDQANVESVVLSSFLLRMLTNS